MSLCFDFSLPSGDPLWVPGDDDTTAGPLALGPITDEIDSEELFALLGTETETPTMPPPPPAVPDVLATLAPPQASAAPLHAPLDPVGVKLIPSCPPLDTEDIGLYNLGPSMYWPQPPAELQARKAASHKRKREADQLELAVGCKCLKRQCRTLYCICWRQGKKCDPRYCTTCTGTCANDKDNPGGARAHVKDHCACRKNQCRTRYCVCYAANRPCGDQCHCSRACKNPAKVATCQEC